MKVPSFLFASVITIVCLDLSLATPLRAEDNDGDAKPGFFHRLGNALFKGTRKIEKDGPDTAGAVDPENMGPSKHSTSKTTRTKTVPAPGPPISDTTAVSTGGPQVVSKDVYVSPPAKKQPPLAANKTEPTDSNAKTTATTSSPSTGKDNSASSSDSKEYPLATHAKKAGFVKSPYPPYHELDVTGMPSGTLARDPTSGKIFRIP